MRPHRALETTEKVLKRYDIISSRFFWILQIHSLEYGSGTNPGRIEQVHSLEYGSGTNPGRIEQVHSLEYGTGTNPGRRVRMHWLESGAATSTGWVGTVHLRRWCSRA